MTKFGPDFLDPEEHLEVDRRTRGDYLRIWEMPFSRVGVLPSGGTTGMGSPPSDCRSDGGS